MKAYGMPWQEKKMPPTHLPTQNKTTWLIDTHIPPDNAWIRFPWQCGGGWQERKAHAKSRRVGVFTAYEKTHKCMCKCVGVIVWDGSRWVAATYRQTVFVWMEIWDGPLCCWSIGSRSFQFLSISLIFPPAERDAGICLPAFSLLNPAQQPTSTPPDSPLWTVTAG